MLGNIYPKKNTNNDENELFLTELPPQELAETQEIDSESQTSFALDRTRITRIQKARQDIRRWENIVEVMPFWRIPINSINITLGLITTGIVAVLVAQVIGSSVNQVHYYYSQLASDWVQMDKSFAIFVPVAVGVMELLLLRFQRLVFNFDRRLSSVIAVTQCFFNVMLIIAVTQIVNLLLV